LSIALGCDLPPRHMPFWFQDQSKDWSFLFF
jgi:hypothetical protein